MSSDFASMLMSRMCLTGEACARVLCADAKDLHLCGRLVELGAMQMKEKDVCTMHSIC